MNIYEALQSMFWGKKIYHPTTFGKGEYLFMNRGTHIENEEGYHYDFTQFVNIYSSDNFREGWAIYEPQN